MISLWKKMLGKFCKKKKYAQTHQQSMKYSHNLLFFFFFFLFFLNRKSSPSGEAEILDFTVSASCSVSLAAGRLMLAAC